MPVSVQESLAEVWVSKWPVAGSEVLSASVHAWELLKEVMNSTIVWLQVKQQGGTQPHLSKENWIKDLLSMDPLIRMRPSFPLSQSLPSGSFHKLLNLIHQRANRMNHSHRKLIKLITWITACLTQGNYEPCCVGSHKMDGSWWKILTKRGPLEKGMENYSSIFAIGTPKT